MGGSDQNWLNSACHMSENAERPIKRLLFDPDAPTHTFFCFIVLLPAYGTVVPALHNTPILYYLLIRWDMYIHVCCVDNYPVIKSSWGNRPVGGSRPVLPVCSAAVRAAPVNYREQGIALKW